VDLVSFFSTFLADIRGSAAPFLRQLRRAARLALVRACGN